MTFLTLTGCVSRVGPAAVPEMSTLPSRGPVAGECATTDIEVTGGLDEKPEVTLPTDCAPPTTLLARDLTVGTGRQAVRGSNLEVNYVMITWSDGLVLDSTWAGNDSLPLSMTDLGRSGWIDGWDEGVLGIREGGRRLFVVPRDPDPDGTGPGDTLVYVVDATRVF
ncbi:FKBP-type peptidyl-prolyl cis-trans isomerase [Actinophytocola sp.]|uniref:FKBP-type peptidyl-prolyl cis-trans isomerase n=1 Tax=Actinophytocola sp. TaxID=1872138 RepID=UPI002ED0F34D